MKWLDKFKPKKRTTWKHSPFHQGPKKPRVWIPKDPKDGQWVKLWNGKFGVCMGPWINNYQWDGSYLIVTEDEITYYLYPSKFNWTGKTLGEEIQLRKILREKRERQSSLERHEDAQ